MVTTAQELGELFQILPNEPEAEIAKRLDVPRTMKVGGKLYRLCRTGGINSVLTTKKGATNIAKSLNAKHHLTAKVKVMKHIENAHRYAVYLHGWWM